MKLVDANVLLYAVNTDAPHHDDAKRWLDKALGSDETVAFAWVVVLAFLRISTHPSIFPKPLSNADAVAIVEAFLSRPNAVQLSPSPRHLDLIRGLITSTSVGGNLVTDAHLAALALEHDADVVTFDADFARFGVRVVHPGRPSRP